MNKIQLIMTALVIFQFSCTPTEEVDPVRQDLDVDLVSNELQDVFRGAFKMTESLSTIELLERSDNQQMVTFELENITNETQEYFQQQFKTLFELKSPIYLASFPDDGFENDQKMQIVNRLIDSSTAFNVPQKAYIKWLAKDIADTQNYQQGLELVATFRSQVSHSRELSNEEKLILLEIAAGSQALLEFFENGGVEEVRNRMAGMIGNSSVYGKVAGCSVNWRSVWLGAVVGFGWGAARGLILGAVTGTVAVPVVGTVTGAISGAITLGAAGFVGGAIAGVTAELIGSCFRSTKLNQVFSNCDQAWNAYLSKHINAMPVDCFIVPMGLY